VIRITVPGPLYTVRDQMKLAFRFGNTGLPFVPGLGAAFRMNVFDSRGLYLRWRDKTGWKETIIPVPQRKS
jgi:hypothetical protein